MNPDASVLVAVRAVAFEYEPEEAVRLLLQNLRIMINHTLWIGQQRSIRGRFKLIKAVYNEFKRYGLHSHYTLNAWSSGRDTQE